jgi:hypothetical protein
LSARRGGPGPVVGGRGLLAQVLYVRESWCRWVFTYFNLCYIAAGCRLRSSNTP